MFAEGRIRIKADGLNIEKLINNLIKENIPLYNIVRKAHRQVLFSVSFIHSKKVIAYLEKMCYNYQLTGESGLLPFAFFLLKRFALIIGFLFFAVIAASSGFFVSEINVQGCKNIDSVEILRSVNENGVRAMSFGRGNPQDIEKAIYSRFKDIAFVSAKYQGLVLNIKIVESEPVPAVLDTRVRDIVSAFDGKITKLLVFQGTPLVKAGDTVKKGQVLIGGYRTKPDGTQIPLRAMGEAYGCAVLKYSEIFETSKAVLQRSGGVSVTKYIETFGVKFPICSGSAFASCEMETKYSYIFYNNIIPSRLVTVTFYETQTMVITEDFEKVKKIVIEEAEKKAVLNAGKEGVIIKAATTVRDGGAVKYIDTEIHIEKSFLQNGE